MSTKLYHSIPYPQVGTKFRVKQAYTTHNTQHTKHTNRHQVSCRPPTPQRLCPPLRTQHPLRPQIIAPQLSMGPYQACGIGIALTLTCSSVWVWTNKFNASTNRFNNTINPIVSGCCREMLEVRRSGGEARGGTPSNHLDHRIERQKNKVHKIHAGLCRLMVNNFIRNNQPKTCGKGRGWNG